MTHIIFYRYLAGVGTPVKIVLKSGGGAICDRTCCQLNWKVPVKLTRFMFISWWVIQVPFVDIVLSIKDSPAVKAYMLRVCKTLWDVSPSVLASDYTWWQHTLRALSLGESINHRLPSQGASLNAQLWVIFYISRNKLLNVQSSTNTDTLLLRVQYKYIETSAIKLLTTDKQN